MSLHIIGAQINPTVGDIAGNCALIKKCWTANDTADLIVFPELCISGYPPDDLVLKPSFIDAVHDAVMTLVSDSAEHNAAIVIGCPWRDNGNLYNAVHIIHQSAIIGTTYKYNLPTYGVFDEKRIFKPAVLPSPIMFKNQSLGLLICEDMWCAEPAGMLKDKGAESLIVVNASPYTLKKHPTRVNIAKARAQETSLPLFYINQWGGQDDLVFDGCSFYMNENGVITTQAPFFENSILDIQAKSKIPATDHQSLNTLYKALVTGTRDYVRKNGFSQIVLGLSGGIDSALVACIAADALGANNVLAVMLPSRYTSDTSNDDAVTLAKNLKIQMDTLQIGDMHDTITRVIEPYMMHDKTGLTDQNMQSRIRGLTLMTIANASGRLVLSTGNKSEMATGYATLYGDMNGAYNPLKDVYKTLVYKIAAADARIPRSIITKPPSAELKLDQTDQDSLPPYDILDQILNHLIEGEKSIEDCVKLGFSRDTVLDIQRKVFISEYKRRQSPPGPKITTKALGRDRRYPITNGFLE